jgi:hypothetical protein
MRFIYTGSLPTPQLSLAFATAFGVSPQPYSLVQLVVDVRRLSGCRYVRVRAYSMGGGGSHDLDDVIEPRGPLPAGSVLLRRRLCISCPASV